MTHDGNTTSYTYDPMGSLATIKLGTSTVATYTTDAVGNRTRVDFGNGTWQTFSFGTDARYMPTGIDYAYKCNSGDTLGNKGGIRITRTSGGNPLSWADNTDKFIKTFNYDNQGRLANADIPGVSRTDYGYDWVGNRTSPTAVYNDADQLTNYSGNTYSYNTDGNMTSGAGRSYTYHNSGYQNRITVNSINYDQGWDAHGNRAHTWTNGTTTKYGYDITASIPAMIAEGPNDGSAAYYYVREPSGALVMRKNGTDLKYYHFDELGSTLFLTDANGVQTDKYVYNAWGKVVSSSGSTVNPYKYVGRLGYYSDVLTGLYMLGTRFYDPEAGVFTQRDSAKDGLSFYAYTSGQPIVGVDPWGKAPHTDIQWCNDWKKKLVKLIATMFQKLQTLKQDPWDLFKRAAKEKCENELPEGMKHDTWIGHRDELVDMQKALKKYFDNYNRSTKLCPELERSIGYDYKYLMKPIPNAPDPKLDNGAVYPDGNEMILVSPLLLRLGGCAEAVGKVIVTGGQWIVRGIVSGPSPVPVW